jgi:hypothetical protein
VIVETAVDRFCEQGFVVVRGAIPAEVVRACVDEIEAKLLERGFDARDPTTWTEPVVRIDTPEGVPFADASRSPALHRSYDALLGVGRWVPKKFVGGTLPVRFPSNGDPGDTGWHIDFSFGEGRVNIRSRGRGLLALFLFTDVSRDDAPPELIVGSHLDVPRLLAPHGDAGVQFAADTLPASTFERPRAFATGSAGDVYLCHPFLVHRATWPHRGQRPRMVSQPEVPIREPFALRDSAETCAVERAILRGLAAAEGTT